MPLSNSINKSAQIIIERVVTIISDAIVPIVEKTVKAFSTLKNFSSISPDVVEEVMIFGGFAIYMTGCHKLGKLSETQAGEVELGINKSDGIFLYAVGDFSLIALGGALILGGCANMLDTALD